MTNPEVRWRRMLVTTDCSPDLLVVATQGRPGLARGMMGSVAEQVVRHAPCAVLVVRPEIGA